jgi:DNA-binding winged helix-turn-helix (wHTH) protein
MVTNCSTYFFTTPKETGKLPCNIAAWEQMRKQVRDKSTKAILETFNEALCYTVERGMPNLSNFVQIEDELNTCIKTIWRKVGEIKIAHPKTPLELLEAECRSMIQQELTKARPQIERFMTGYTAQYTRQEIEEIGITPPGQFDLWLEVISDTPEPQGTIYIAHREEARTEITPTPFQLLLALVNAPHRRLSQEKLLKNVWGFKVASDYNLISDIILRTNQLAIFVKILRDSLEAKPNQLLIELQRYETKPPYSNLVSLLKKRRKWPDFDVEQFRSAAYQIISEYTEEIKDIADTSNRKRAEETLRSTYNSLRKNLGQIRDEQIINRSKQDEEYFYYLDSSLSICVVVP